MDIQTIGALFTGANVFMAAASLDELRQQLIALVDQAQAINDAAEGARRPMTAAEAGEFDRINDEAGRVNGLIEAEEARLARPRGRQVPPAPVARGMTLPDSVQGGASTTAESQIFGRGAQPSDGFNSFGEYLNSLSSGREDRRLRQAPRDSMEIGTGTAGGYLVPPQFMAEILGGAVVSSQLLSRCNVIPMTSAALAIAGFNSSATHSTGGVGGLTLQWLGEAGTLSEATGVVRSIQLTAHKGAIYCIVSNELLSDAPEATTQLEEIFRAAAAFGIEQAIISGNGAGKPLGILSDPALITVSKEGSQAADTIFAENVYKMYSRMHPSLLGDAVWIANPDVMPQILGLNSRVFNVAGTEVVAGGQPLFIPPGGSPAGPQGSILGRPLILTEAASAVGDVGDLLFVSPKQYALGLRKLASIETSQHLKFDTDQTAFRLIVRVGGQGKWDAALTPRHGQTLSWCVALQAR